MTNKTYTAEETQKTAWGTEQQKKGGFKSPEREKDISHKGPGYAEDDKTRKTR